VISTSDFKKGTKILYQDAPYLVVDFQHVKPGKGGAFVRTKMKNLITGLMHEDTFRSGEKFEKPDLKYHEMQYLYKEGNMYQFMDQETYDQVAFDAKQLGDATDYLKEQSIVTVLEFEGKPISVNPALFIELTVVTTTPGVRGDTAQGGATKPATLETGLVVNIPLFVNEGDIIKVDTRDASYIERVKKQ
jgi:elongation factor P